MTVNLVARLPRDVSTPYLRGTVPALAASVVVARPQAKRLESNCQSRVRSPLRRSTLVPSVRALTSRTPSASAPAHGGHGSLPRGARAPRRYRQSGMRICAHRPSGARARSTAGPARRAADGGCNTRCTRSRHIRQFGRRIVRPRPVVAWIAAYRNTPTVLSVLLRATLYVN